MSAVRESQKRKREALLVEIETRTLRRQQANSHDTTIRTYQPVLVQSSSPSLLCPSPLQSLFEMSVPSSPGITRLVILVLLFSILCLLAQSFPTVSKTYLKSRSTYASVMAMRFQQHASHRSVCRANTNGIRALKGRDKHFDEGQRSYTTGRGIAGPSC